GCHPCDANVCESHLIVVVTEPGGGPLQAGNYVIDLTVDGVTDAATCDIGPGGATATCSALAMADLSAPRDDSPSNPLERLTLTWRPTVPEVVKIHIEHDGVVVLDTTVEPAYDPVDETCAPGCNQPSEDLVLDRG
ncbi:MAG TPA: hypothetical protein VGB85_02110, partial [Nannocystis sp.]